MAQSNIILITAERHRWDCLHAYGHPDLPKANLDALAGYGVSFPQTIAQALEPVVSRTVLLTGQYPGHLGLLEPGAEPLSPTIPSLPRLLKQAGYYTAGVGALSEAFRHRNAGFDKIYPLDGPGNTYEAQRHTAEASGASLPERLHPTTWIGDRALRCLQQAQEPFFLHVAFSSPSPDTRPNAPWDTLYDPATLTLPQEWCMPVPEEDAAFLWKQDIEPQTRSEYALRYMLSLYYAAISQLDKQVGRILATLTARGFTHNFFAYTAATGAPMGHHGLFFEQAGYVYDTHVRVPLILAGLAGQRRGMADSALVQLVDVMPTLLEVAGIPAPKSLQGRSLIPHLNQAEVPSRKAAFSEGAGVQILRTDRYKLVEADDVQACSLHDLQEDPHEFTNVWNRPSHTKIQKDLKHILSILETHNKTTKEKNQ